jgi:antitoxin component YwqK of YwqJK toxin-antitoxin module
VVIKAKNRNMAEKNLDYINSQIRKNTPVKFKEVDYKGYIINYLHIPGFFRMILGKLLERLEKPYYTIIDRYVIFSNHPQTLKGIIDDYESGNTLANSVEFHNFSKNFSSKSSVFLYIQTPLFLNNLKEFASPVAWQGLQKNKEYINAFPQIGFQVNTADDLLKLELAAQFFESVEDFAPVRYEIEAIEPLPTDLVASVRNSDSSGLSGESETRESKIIVDDLDAGRHDEYYENGQIKLTVGLKNGLKHGNFKEYYENGTLKVRGRYKDDMKTGKWSYYNDKGELMDEKEY